MIEGQRGGSILITASSNGFRAEQSHGSYNPAKLDVTALMRMLAGELGPHGIRVNTIHPTNVKTTMTWNDKIVDLFKPGETTQSIGRDEWYAGLEFMHLLPFSAMEPADVSQVLMFLASNAGRFITATEVPIDGGYVQKVDVYPSV